MMDREYHGPLHGIKSIEQELAEKGPPTRDSGSLEWDFVIAQDIESEFATLPGLFEQVRQQMESEIEHDAEGFPEPDRPWLMESKTWRIEDEFDRLTESLPRHVRARLRLHMCEMFDLGRDYEVVINSPLDRATIAGLGTMKGGRKAAQYNKIPECPNWGDMPPETKQEARRYYREQRETENKSESARRVADKYAEEGYVLKWTYLRSKIFNKEK
jgi:hypothetical protein